MAENAIWFRKNNGDWNGDPSADPSTQTGRLQRTGVTAPMAPPYCAAVGGSTGFFGQGPCLYNFGASSFAFTPPSGASAWGAATTLNPLDKAPGITLSNGNLGMNLGGEVSGGVRSTTSQDGTGLVYVEVTVTAIATASNWAWGVARSNAQINPPLLNAGWLFDNWATVALNGEFQQNRGDGTGVVQGTLGSSFAEGDVVCIALFTEFVPHPTVDMADFWFGSTDTFVDFS